MMKKVFIYLGILLLLSGCFEPIDQIAGEQSITFQLMKSADIDVASAVCVVSSDDMDTLVVTLTVTPTSVSGEIKDVPYGEDRLFEIKTYNSSGLMNYYGSTLIDINSIAPEVDIVLHPVDLTADVTINGTFSDDDEETLEKIVFSADWNGSLDIYIMDTDGTNIRQLTNSSENDRYPQLSPDRSRICFYRGEFSYIFDLETMEVQETGLDSIQPWCMSWHPTENSVIFSSGLNDENDIYSYDFDTEVLTPLVVNDETNWVPVFSPSGTEFTYYSKVDGLFRAYIANADGSDLRYLNPEGHADERLPHINPEYANLILFSGRNYGNNAYSTFGLFIFDREYGTVNELMANSDMNESWPNWSPDGEKVIYERNSGGNYGIYVVNRDGSEPKALLDTQGNEYYPHWR